MTRLPFERQTFQWCVGCAVLIDDHITETRGMQTSMFVPDPVISQAIKPIGAEMLNFSLVFNRFQKEDAMFRVRIDHESQEVHLFPSICHHLS